MLCYSRARVQCIILRNLIRLGDEDEGAAETGVTETTTETIAYTHPTNDKITFWDLPGIGAYTSYWRSNTPQNTLTL